MKKMIKSLANKAICAAFVVLGAASVCAEVITNKLYDAVNTDVEVGYEIKGLADGRETAVVFTKDSYDISWTVPATLENVQFLVVGGGGGGGAGTWGPGGGGGGVVTGYVYQLKKNVAVDITVGAGGDGGTTNGSRGGYGKDSSIFVSDVSYVVAKGGGAGKNKTVGGDGGSSSGGGASSSYSYAGGNVVTNDYDSTFVFAESFGEKGGANGKSAYCSGGGGGATGVGSAGSGSKGGAGGAGLKMDITGSLIIYGSGGGGGGKDTKGSGGTNAGNGGSNSGNATSAKANCGGGGGGGGRNNNAETRKGGAGGSGIVVLRYALPAEVVAKIGETEYASISDAVSAAVAGDVIKLEKDIALDETLVIPAAKEGLTIDLNGKTITGAEGAKLSNLGTLTVTDSSSEMTGMFEVKFSNAGTANLTGGVFALGVENTGTIEVTGGVYLASAFNRAWVKSGYACCDVGDDETAIIAVAKLPTATVTSISNDELVAKNAPKDLTYSLKFTADQVSEFQMLCFTNWYADFEFTISADAKFNCSSANSDGYLAGQYDSWAKNWISVPTTDVELKANEALKIMDFGAGLLKKPGLKMTYGEVATLVKEFSCGVALRPEFIAKNPGLTVKLSLKMYNPKNESESYTIGEEFTFETTSVAATIGKTTYATLADAVTAAVAGDTIKIEKDITLNETFVVPADKEDFTIDLNGKTIAGAEGAKLSNFGTLTITDSSALMQGMIGVQFSNAGTANLKGGVFALGVENTGTIEVTGGAYLASAFDRAWVKAGYVCCDLGDDEMAIIAVAKLPTATITSLTKAELEEKNAPKDLNYTLKFKANKVSEFQMLCFTNWYADFEFTISADAKFNCSSATSDGYLAGQYDSWAKNWISVPTTDVELKANEPLRIMDFGAGLLKKPGLKMTYGEVATLVKEFSCGVALRPEFIAKNPGLTVKLTLKMYNPKNESEFYTIGNEYTFELPAETDNAIIVGSSGAAINCETLQDAIDAIADLEGSANGSEISILKNYEINDDLTVSGTRNLFFNIGENKSITLAEGKKITISGANVAIVGEGMLVGFTADNIELEDKSVLTLPETAQALAESFEAKGKYVTQNDDETWSVANELTLQIQVVDGEPSVGFLKDTRRDYTIEGSADLKIWGDIEADEDSVIKGADIALPLKWHKPASGYFFRVKAEKKSN